MKREKGSLGRQFRKALRTGLLCGVALLSTDCATVNNAGPPAPVDIGEMASKPLIQQLFDQNVRPDKKFAAQFNAMSPKERLDYEMTQVCFMADKDPGKSALNKDVKAALDRLNGLPLLGKPLVDVATRDRVNFCGLPRLPAGIAAEYMGGPKTIVAGGSPPREELTLLLAHEMTHGAQDDSGLLTYYMDWDISSRAGRNLGVEAAALTTEFMVAFEAKTEGNAAYWNFLQTHYAGTTYNDKETYRLIETGYQSKIDSGASKQDALIHAAGLAWRHVYESPDWRNFYLNLELTGYVRDISQNAFSGHPVITSGRFDAARRDKAGKLGDLPSFTKGIEAPTLDSLLQNNVKMRWAYQAADIARYRQAQGPGSAAAQLLQAAAEKDANPYLGLDMRDINRRIAASNWDGGGFKYVYQLMDMALADLAAAPAAPAAAPRVAAPRNHMPRTDHPSAPPGQP